MTPIEKRHAATQATLDRFRDRPFRWGSVDCARMASFHLKRAGVKIAVAKAGSYRSAGSAVAALGIVVGNGNMLAFHESAETPVIMTMGRINCAWQVI